MPSTIAKGGITGVFESTFDGFLLLKSHALMGNEKNLLLPPAHVSTIASSAVESRDLVDLDCPFCSC